MIEVLRLVTGKLLISAGPHCVESEADDASLDVAIDALAEKSGQSRTRIALYVSRATLGEMS